LVAAWRIAQSAERAKNKRTVEIVEVARSRL
jgi:hypothetical protein